MQNDNHKDIENLLSAMYADQIKGFTSEQRERLIQTLAEAEVHPSLAKVSNSSLKPSEPIRVFNPNVQIIDRKVGRNEPCPCGSGKKYKNCCGK